MATIPINDKYRIKSGPHSWDIQRFVPAGEKTPAHWQSFKYYGSLQKAVEGLGNRLIREAKTETLADLLREAERIAEVLRNATSINVRVTTEAA